MGGCYDTIHTVEGQTTNYGNNTSRIITYIIIYL